MTKMLNSEVKSDFLIEKGIELLWSKGYNGTSVNDIVKAADVPKGSFYFYFKSKEDFVIKVIEKYFDCHFGPAKQILNNKLISPKQRLLDFHQYRYDMLKNEMEFTKGCLACNIGTEMSDHNENIRQAIMVKEQLVLSLIADVIKEAQDLGEINKTIKAEDMAAFIEDAGKGAMTTMKEMKSSYPIDNFMNVIKTIFIR